MIFPGMEKIYSSETSCHSSGEICHPQQQARGEAQTRTQCNFSCIGQYPETHLFSKTHPIFHFHICCAWNSLSRWPLSNTMLPGLLSLNSLQETCSALYSWVDPTASVCICIQD